MNNYQQALGYIVEDIKLVSRIGYPFYIHRGDIFQFGNKNYKVISYNDSCMTLEFDSYVRG